MRRILLALSAFFFAWAALVVATGGIQWRIAGVLFRSRDPQRALLALIALLFVQVFLFREPFERDVDRVVALARRASPWLAGIVAAVAVAHALRYGGCTAGGSDSYGYVSEAYGWETGHLPRAYDLPLSLPFPSGDVMQMPLGYRAGPAPHTMVPTYAPGLPLLMAVGIRLTGAIGPYLVVPISAGLFVWFTFCLGRRAAGPIGGLVAAIVAATSPIVLFQSLWPMSDVPAGALWTGAIVGALGTSRRSALLGGLSAAIGLFVRPNLPLLAVVLALWIFASARGRERYVRAAIFCAPILPVVFSIAALNAMWYGSPFTSGYGRTADIYALANVWPNLQRYPVWLWHSQSPWILVSLLSAVAFVRPWPGRSAVALAWIFFLATAGSYIAYSQFEEWWYLRFLLPGLGAFYVLMAVGLTILAGLVARPWGKISAAVIVLLIVKSTTGFALDKSIFGPLKRSEHRYADVAEFINHALPENAVVLAMQHSGNVRIWGGRLTLRYDFIDPEWAPRVVPELEQEGLHPYLTIDDWEEPDVKRHLGLAADRPLPWPYIARMRDSGGVTIYDLATTRAPAAPVVALEPESSPQFSAPKEIVLKPRGTH